jgi:glutaredoxin
MSAKKVKLYGLSTCPWCRKAKQFFKDHNIEIEAVDFDKCEPAQQKEFLAEMKQYGAGESFPFVLIGGDPVEGFNTDSYCNLLGIKE